MITALTPDQVAQAMVKIYREGRSKSEVARRLGVDRLTLRHAVKEARRYGFTAFSLTALRSRAEPLCSGRTLDGCHQALTSAGLFNGNKDSLRSCLRHAGIEYLKAR